MKFITPFFIVAITLLQTSVLHSQDLQIQQKNKTKTFKTGHLIKVELTNRPDSNCNSCSLRYIIGRIVSYKKDTLQLQIKIENQPVVVNGQEIGNKELAFRDKMKEEWPFIRIPSSSILSITKQGIKHWNEKNAGDQVGIGVITVGLISLIAAAYTDDEQKNDSRVSFGVTTIAAGLITVAIFDRKTYYIENPLQTKTHGGHWRIK